MRVDILHPPHCLLIFLHLCPPTVSHVNFLHVFLISPIFYFVHLKHSVVSSFLSSPLPFLSILSPHHTSIVINIILLPSPSPPPLSPSIYSHVLFAYRTGGIVFWLPAKLMSKCHPHATMIQISYFLPSLMQTTHPSRLSLHFSPSSSFAGLPPLLLLLVFAV